MISFNTQTRRDLDALIVDFNETRAALIEVAQSVPSELRDVALVGHWDVKDVMAHTVGWDYANVEALPDFA
ncbi:MAG TPA: hypothetical protein VI876_10865, partial [Dehalococcoidia bacterium]|nr:hypothetical protein [Dehalococcoidia bacterium]